MLSDIGIKMKMDNLKMRLHELTKSWTVSDYEDLLKFYVEIVPRIMDAERCSIFIVEPGKEKVWLKYGTGLQEKEIVPPVEGTVVGNAITSGKAVIENSPDRHSEYHTDLEAKTGFITRNLICAPIKYLTSSPVNAISGAVEVLNKTGGQFTQSDCDLVGEVAKHLAIALENILINHEIVEISKNLNKEMEKIWRDEIQMIAESKVMQDILNTVQVVSATPVNILIQGESGTGKEIIARIIHSSSERRDKLFIPINCAAVPENLVESEFFGYEKGAFTGAVTSRKGKFEEAHQGTLFLDELGDMPMLMQPKFLRVLQEGEGSRLGSNKPVSYDLRIISATNKDLRKEIAEGRFREDFFYRVFSVEIYIPPLRERREDIIPMALFFLNRVSKKFGKRVAGFSDDVLNFFEAYPWPGNVRQLQHEVERLVALTPEGGRLSLMHCSQELLDWKSANALEGFKNTRGLSLPEKVRELEIRCIKDALHETKGNKVQASRLLGITRQGMDKKIKRYNNILEQ